MAAQRIAVIGSTGQLGTDLVEVLRLDDKGETLPLSHAGEATAERPPPPIEMMRGNCPLAAGSLMVMLSGSPATTA